jgi:hypothetical protein
MQQLVHRRHGYEAETYRYEMGDQLHGGVVLGFDSMEPQWLTDLLEMVCCWRRATERVAVAVMKNE